MLFKDLPLICNVCYQKQCTELTLNIGLLLQYWQDTKKHIFCLFICIHNIKSLETNQLIFKSQNSLSEKIIGSRDLTVCALFVQSLQTTDLLVCYKALQS